MRPAASAAASGLVDDRDAAGLAAPAGQHLRLDDDLAAELGGRRTGLVDGPSRPVPHPSGMP